EFRQTHVVVGLRYAQCGPRSAVAKSDLRDCFNLILARSDWCRSPVLRANRGGKVALFASHHHPSPGGEPAPRAERVPWVPGSHNRTGTQGSSKLKEYQQPIPSSDRDRAAASTANACR